MIQGKLSLREIATKSMDVEFNQSDAWVKEALVAAAPHEELTGKTPQEWAEASTCSGHMRAERLEPEYSLEGSFTARLPLLCPRCGEEGSVGREGNFRIFLRPVGPRETVEMGDDPDYVILDSAWINLGEVLTEQVVAAEPVVERPDLSLDGTPHSCELSAGQNGVKAGSSPFAILEKLKGK